MICLTTFAADNNKRLNLICVISVVAVLLVWLLYIFNKGGVACEGWYSLYADMIIAGKIPYVDFEFCFPPFYLYLITTIVYVFGDSLIVLRVFGIMVFLSIFFVTYKLLGLIFPPWVASIASFTMMLFMQSENAYVFYDYTRVYDLLNCMSLYLLLRYVTLGEAREKSGKILLGLTGIILSLSFLTRQSSGAIVIAFVVIFIVVYYYLNKDKMQKSTLFYFFAGLLIPMVIVLSFLLFHNCLIEYIQMTITSGNKGGIWVMLFRWLKELFMNGLTTIVLTLVICMYVFSSLKDKQLFYLNKNQSCMPIIVAIATLLVLLSMIWGALAVERVTVLRNPYLISLFVIDVFIFVTSVLHALLRRTEDGEDRTIVFSLILISGFIFAICYGSGTSAGLSLGEGGLNCAFVIAIMLSLTKIINKQNEKKVFAFFVMFLVIISSVSSIAVKINEPYNWWGMKEIPYSMLTEHSDINYYQGMLLSGNEKQTYEDYVTVTEVYLSDSDMLYCYSQVTVFYTIINKIPVVKAPVCWFDVSREQTLIDDLDYLKANSPKMIVFADHGEYTIRAHEEAFGNNGKMIGHRAMYDWLLFCRDNVDSNYAVVRSYNINSYPVYVMVLKTAI